MVYQRGKRGWCGTSEGYEGLRCKRSEVCCFYLFDGRVHSLRDVQRLGHHVGGHLGELVLVVDHQGAAVGHHNRVGTWE